MERIFDRMGKLGFGLLASGVFMSNFVFVVEPGHRAIIQNNLKGLGTYVYGEGMHIKVPIRDNVKMFEVRTRPTLISAAAGTKDMQIVNVTMRVLFRPVEQELSTILLKLGTDYDNRVVPPSRWKCSRPHVLSIRPSSSSPSERKYQKRLKKCC